MLSRYGSNSRSINPGKQSKCDNIGIMMKFPCRYINSIVNPIDNIAQI